jgi:hypothetical protein
MYSCDVKMHAHNDGPVCWTAPPTKLSRPLLHRQLASRLSRTRYSSDIPSLHLLCPFSGAPTYMVANVIVFPVLLVLYSWARWWLFFGSLFCVAVVRFIHPSGLIFFVAIAHKSPNVLAQPLLLLRALGTCDVCMPSMWCARAYPTEPRVRAGGRVCTSFWVVLGDARWVRHAHHGGAQKSQGAAKRQELMMGLRRTDHTRLQQTRQQTALAQWRCVVCLHARVPVCARVCVGVCVSKHNGRKRQSRNKSSANIRVVRNSNKKR